MFKRTISDIGSVEFTHRKTRYVVTYSVTNDGFLLPHYENIGQVKVDSYDAFITAHGDLDRKIEKVFEKKLPKLRIISADRYFLALKAGTLPTSQFTGEDEKVTKSDQQQPVAEPKELVTKSPGYKRRTNNPAMGRPAIGSTRKVSLSLPDDVWEMIDKKVGAGEKVSAVIRELIEKGRAV